ncbi:MAG TPA: sugar porter family MFS transporter [Terriglobales bacterium]|jgi:SP family arabinose:H+ symporter-like MFS transporter|nr:sugar porter family MFS transporter [Terriglobales bacterium]
MALNSTLVKSTVVAALGGLLFGFDTAVISGTTSNLSQVYSLPSWLFPLVRLLHTPDKSLLLGITVSSALIGTIIGAMFAGIPGDKWGRRDSLRLLAVVYVVSALGCALAPNWYALVCFRFIGGLGIGGSSVLGPMYIAEIAPAQWRGRLVGVFQFNVVAGILIAYLSNFIVGSQHLGIDAEWRWKLGVAAAPAFLFLGLLFTIPRSPRWLVKKQRVAEARAVLQQIGEENYEHELQEIVASIDAEHGLENEPLFLPKYKLPIFLAISIGMFNQLSGINAILYYLNDIFASAGFSKMSGDLQAVTVGFTNLIFTVIAMSVIDRFGRKKMLLVGAVGTAICLAGVAAIFFTNRHQELLVWLLVGFIASFAFSQGSVIWVYLSEVFPNRVRAKGQSLGSLSHWLMNAIISFAFPTLAAWSRPIPFVFFSAMMAVQFVVVLLVYPETKGVSLEDMEKKLATV